MPLAAIRMPVARGASAAADPAPRVQPPMVYVLEIIDGRSVVIVGSGPTWSALRLFGRALVGERQCGPRSRRPRRTAAKQGGLLGGSEVGYKPGRGPRWG